MGSHIATNSSFDAPEIPRSEGKCLFCCKVTMQAHGWLGSRCTSCNEILGDEVWMGSLCAHYRRELGMSKQQLADAFKCKKNSISYYEQKKCNQQYFDFLQNLMRAKV